MKKCTMNVKNSEQIYVYADFLESTKIRRFLSVILENHDVTAYMFQNMDNKKYKMRYGEIKIGDNVFCRD